MTCYFTKIDTPPTGWIERRVVDLVPDDLQRGEDSSGYMQPCVVCGTSVRYVHIMSHPLTGAIAEVGCECAGRMSGMPEVARRREKDAKNVAKRRANFPGLPWRKTLKGGFFLKRNGVVYSIRKGQWGSAQATWCAWTGRCGATGISSCGSRRRGESSICM